jgi:hypothetical protein
MAKALPKEVLDALAKIEPQFRQAFLDAFQRVADAAEIARIADLIEAGQIDAAARALNVNPTVLAALHEAERAALVTGGNLVLSGLRIRDPFTGSRVVLGFDGRAIRAEQWAAQASSRLITEIVDDQMQMAREVIRAGIETGRNPRQVALDLVGRIDKATGKRSGGFIGLTSQQAQWVMNAERQLRDLDAGYFSRGRRDKRYDRLVLRAIKDGKPLAEADIRQITQRYRDRLLNLRGETIARTEALNALRAGRHEGYQQLIDSGNVRSDQVTVTWSATMDGRTRDSHQALNGQKIRFGQLFTSPLTGARLEYPGDTTHGAPGEETIACRCYAEYSIRYL